MERLPASDPPGAHGRTGSLPSVVDLFRRAVAECGCSLAVADRDGDLTYNEFAARVSLLFQPIASCARRPRVLLALPPGADAYAAMMATSIAGGVYAPVHHHAPLQRQREIARRFRPDIIVAPTSTSWRLGEVAPAAQMLDPTILRSELGGCKSGERLPPLNEEGHPVAYVIFTSGSTGSPKGVEIPRSSLDHYIRWVGPAFDIRYGDRVSQFSSLAFDASVNEVYGALCYGASLHPPDGQAERLFPAGMMRRHRLTHWISVPSVVGMINQADELTPENTASIRRFIFGGEPLTTKHVAGLLKVAPHAVVLNTYGPTEATVCVTSVCFHAEDVAGLSDPHVPLGGPNSGTDLQLLGGPHEDEGEIVLFGPQLALGYLDDPAETARAFRLIRTPTGDRRAYFTGDWARRINGQLYFCERTDFQIKHRGHRLEAGDIQAALVASGATGAIAFVHGGKLVALVEDGSATGLTPTHLRKALTELLEPFAIPDEIVVLPRFPRNDNDKLDRNRAIEFYHGRVGAPTFNEAESCSR